MKKVAEYVEHSSVSKLAPNRLKGGGPRYPDGVLFNDIKSQTERRICNVAINDR
jgi:hypothetical protein